MADYLTETGVALAVVIVIAAIAGLLLLRRRGRVRRVGGGGYRPSERQHRPATPAAPREVPRPFGEPDAHLPDGFDRLSEDELAEVTSLILGKRKIEAIKLVRLASGLGLKEAKEAVEDYERRL